MGTEFFFAGGKVAGTWRYSTAPSNAEVEERVKLFGLHGLLQGEIYLFTFLQHKT
jgi:hypothetical protein